MRRSLARSIGFRAGLAVAGSLLVLLAIAAVALLRGDVRGRSVPPERTPGAASPAEAPGEDEIANDEDHSEPADESEEEPAEAAPPVREDLAPLTVELEGEGVVRRKQLVPGRLAEVVFEDLPRGGYTLQILDLRLQPWRRWVRSGTLVSADLTGSAGVELSVVDARTREPLRAFDVLALVGVTRWRRPRGMRAVRRSCGSFQGTSPSRCRPRATSLERCESRSPRRRRGPS